jgi:hypothetical protein
LGFKSAIEFGGIKEAGIKGDGLNAALVSLEYPLSGFCKLKAIQRLPLANWSTAPAGNENATGPG